MFEAAELGATVSSEEYKSQASELRLELLRHQFRVRDAGAFPVIIVLAGDDSRGCEETLGMLHEWMDPRYVETYATGRVSDEERERPEFWRYWRHLPAKGRVGVFLGGWPEFGILRRVRQEFTETTFLYWIRHVRCFEQQLVDDGAAIVKLWMHVPQEVLQARLSKAKKHPDESWRIHDDDREVYADYDRGRRIAEQVLRMTSTGDAPWHVIESTDWRARNLSTARKVLRAMSKRLAAAQSDPTIETIYIAQEGVESSRTVLDKVDLSQSLKRNEYEKSLEKEQRRIRALTHRALDRGVSTVFVFEGWDAAGKGGAVRRLTAAMSASLFHVVPIAAPNDEERSRHWLWRFWRQLPRAGEIVVFDRSWYGRVLVERVEELVVREDWRRAYAEINDFEEQLVEQGILVQKYWIHIDPDEQLRRFQERENSPLKRFKITDEDWRNREQWPKYERAVNEMVGRTSTAHAPWVLVAGNDKCFARIQVLHTFRKRLEDALSGGDQ